ncbi:inovirus Gp2 family protein [Marinomonas sp. ef1]|uniref:inovirus Gp2 family protein n=1 Tax=Marinomonas sp. ef1 TaxID=2005043 RepID=UPI0012FE042F|nr:inovirus Gp2 family protein [Marinomonas sp. ef1]
MTNTFNNLPIHSPLATSNKDYLIKLVELINTSISLSSRVTAFRFDLRFPESHKEFNDGTITKFFESLKAQLTAKDKKTFREGRRVHPNNLRYAWVRERDSSISDHYHCVILVNKDAYSILGNYDKWGGNMASRIKLAWVSALGGANTPIEGLVHFPKNGTYYLDLNKEDYWKNYSDLFYRLSYFAKNATKCYGDGRRSFGCSRL